jgi:putative endonuclease
MDRRARTGVAGEDATAELYAARGYGVVARNWRCRLGELDLVVERGDLLVVCEVKARRGDRFGGGHEAVTSRKRAKLRALGQAFLLASRRAPSSMRFDVASVRVVGDRCDVELFEDAF